MEVVLLTDVKNLGKRGEVKKVTAGFARNLLLPRKLAIVATPEVKARAERAQHHSEEAKKAQQKKLDAQSSKLEKRTVIVKQKANSAGTLFRAVKSAIIAEKLFEQHGIRVEPKNIKIAEPIKKIGEYPIDVSINGTTHQLTLQVKST